MGDWLPISKIPLGYKDGRPLRLKTYRYGKTVMFKGYWQDNGPNAESWVNEDDEPMRPTHFFEKASGGNR